MSTSKTGMKKARPGGITPAAGKSNQLGGAKRTLRKG